MMRSVRHPALLSTLLVLASVLAPATSFARVKAESPSSDPIRSCASLAMLSFGDGSKVTSAAEVPATDTVPGFCSVTLLVPDRINISVMLPTEVWNGRYLALGNGGYGGAILYGGLTPPTARLADGYVVSATDTGHQGSMLNGEWAWSPTGMNHAQIQDFAHRANHQMAVKSKAVIRYFYGRGPSYSYWFGSSSGGREGLTEAMRYPRDFDGIVSGFPAINWTRFIPAEMWPQLVMKEEGNFLPASKAAAVTRIVTAACDRSDGLKDGLFDPRQCNFSAQSLLGKQTPAGPFTTNDVRVIRKIWQGPRRADGRFLWYGLEPGADLGSKPGLTLAGTVGPPNGPAVDGVPFTASHDWFKWWLHKDPTWDWHTLTYRQFEKDFDQSVREWADPLATREADLSRFRDHGGKVLIWHGMADELIFPQGSIDYYNRVVQHMGGPGATRRFARLFLAPGVGHTIPGPMGGPRPADPLAAVVRWREHGIAPDRLRATLAPNTGANTTDKVMSRPLCPYPQVARYDGTGSTFQAKNFTCGGHVR